MQLSHKRKFISLGVVVFLEMEKFLNETVCPIDIEWKLNKKPLMLYFRNGCLSGKYFSANNIPGILYNLKLFPNSKGRTWIFFNMNGLEERKITAEFKISVESANFSETYNFVFEDDMEYGIDICATSEFYDPLMKFFIDDEITIKVEGFLKTKHPSTPETVCPIDSEWNIKKADIMDLVDSKNKSLKGKYFYAFNIPGLRYNVKIYPNGDNEEHHGDTWIFFHVKDFYNRNSTSDLKMVIESANVSESLKYIFKNRTRHGIKICKMDEFFDSKNKYFLNGEITIKVNGTLKTNICSKSRACSQLSMQWKIKEADLKEVFEEESNEGILCSDVKKDASFSKASYYLKICPSEIDDENKSKAFTYVNVDLEYGENIGAVFDYSGETANFNRFFSVGYAGFGFRTFLCSTEDLFDPSKGFFANGYLTINVSGILIKEENVHSIALNCKNGVAPKTAFESDDKDFLLVVREKEIQVHKQVLMEVSSVFAEMFESEMKESVIENKFVINNFAFTTVDAAIKLCYGINVSLKYSLENLLSLYKFGHEFRIVIIMDLIEEYLIKEISPPNVVYLLKFSSPDSFNIKKLYQSCIEFFIKCSKDSIPIYAAESLGEKFLASMILNTFSSKC